MSYIDQISDALLGARKARTPLDGFPGELPKDLDEAYAIQMRSIEKSGWKVAGWKAGGVPAHLVDKFKTTRQVGPAFEDTVQYFKTGDTVTMPIYPGGFAAVEGEYIAVLGNVPDRDVTLDDMDAIVTSLHIGLELASSPMKEINNIGPQAIVSDFGNNAGILVGPQIDKDTDFTKHEVSVTIDGVLAGKQPSGLGDKGPYGAVVFVVNHLRRLGVAIAPGTLVATGAVSGVHDATDGSRSHVIFGTLGDFYVELTAE